MLKALSAFYIILFLHLSSFAELNLPRGLNRTEQVKVATTLGSGLIPKVLSNPYPLGGYRGVELGISTEFIPTENIKSLGTGSNLGSEFELLRFSVGKGLFNDVDVFFFFSPSFQKSNISSYGVDLRYNFYRAKALPILFTVRASGGSGSYDNQLVIGNYGVDLLGSLTIDDLTVYGGFGQVTMNAFIPGGVDSLASDLESQRFQILQTKTIAGFVYSLENYFFAFELNRFEESFFGAKLGYRF